MSATTLLAQAADDPPAPGITDNAVLDQFEIPFGAWMDQAVDWITVNLKWLLTIIEWPFQTLIGFLVEDILEPISWVWVVVAFFVVGSLVRNVRVGAFAAFGLGVCGILGNAYWLETARTIGFVGVAVLLCVIVGIPLGIACGRVDAIWQVVRPILDAMQVVHSFVYMLPFIYFFGIGEVSATMVTMVFALPPLVRLTNLGIRQVPEDVVEASRAYGAPEWRVLTDVQVPLARPAIMTGINQTLLLAISMLGIAAIMGAGGLGRLLFGALSRQSVAEGAASGLAFFLVAVVLDRISQRETDSETSLFRRIRRAWSHLRDPESLLEDETAAVDQARNSTDGDTEGSFAAVTPAERRGVLLSALGGLVAVVSVFLTWHSDAGFLTAYGRRADENLAGMDFNGLSVSGGSWFGYATLGLGLLILAASLNTLLAPGRFARWWAADGAVICSFALLVMSIAYLGAQPSDLAAASTTGAGVWTMLVGAIIAAAGSLWWIHNAPHAPIRPLSARVGWGRVIAAGVAVIVIFAGMFSGWSFDRRADVIITDDVQAQIDELKAKAEADPSQSGVAAAQISALTSELAAEKVIVTDGLSNEGARLGLWTLLASIVGLIACLPAAGVLGRREHRQWIWSSAVAGIGAGIVVIALAWVVTLTRSADDNYLSGVGAFLAMGGGSVLAASAASVLREFRRTRVYSETGARPAEVTAT